MKVYCAGPFFNESQLSAMEKIEGVLSSFKQLELFLPRNSTASAKKLNREIGAGKDPSQDTRRAVFMDNVNNIDDADLLVALIDDRDIGTIFEIGYAYARGVPVITYTDKNYGMNLMLAESVIAHTKGTEQLRDAVEMFIEHFDRYGGPIEEEFDAKFKRANLSEAKEADRQLTIYALCDEDEEGGA